MRTNITLRKLPQRAISQLLGKKINMFHVFWVWFINTATVEISFKIVLGKLWLEPRAAAGDAHLNSEGGSINMADLLVLTG